MDHEKFGTFINEYKQDIFLMIRTRVNSTEDAQDIMQDVLLKIYQGMDKFRGDAHVRTWIYKIARNSIADYYKRPWWRIFKKIKENKDIEAQKSPTHDLDGSMADNPEEILMANERKNQILSEVNRMPRLEKETFLLRFMDGFSLKQISDMLDMNINTVKTHLYRAVKKAGKQNSSC